MKKKKTIVLLCLFILALKPVFAQSPEKEVDKFVWRQMKELGIPGLQVAVVKGGKIALNKSYGYANLQDSVAVSSKSLFAINSCTKVFTGVAMMQLVEEGKVELSAPVSRYLDGLPASWQPVTIIQLMTHISGLPDINRSANMVGNTMTASGKEGSAWDKVQKLPMDFPTGEQFSYNQTNGALLGMIIEKLSGKPFPEVFKERQFDVAGMPRTMFGDSRNVIPHFAPTYRYTKEMDGKKLKEPVLVNNYNEFAPTSWAGSGLNSTAEEMAKWVIALQQGKFLKTKEALQTMWTPAKFNNGSPTSWTPGWGIAKIRAKHRAFGMSGGGRSAFLIYPDDDLAVIVLTNLGGSSPENFIEELAGLYNPDIPASDPVTLLRVELNKRGYAKAMEVVNEQKKKDPAFQPVEHELNDWAYRMMSKGQDKEALEIFKLNVSLFPDSWNVYDSYGEVLWKVGQKEEAIKMYTKSVALNPDNQGGKRALEQLTK